MEIKYELWETKELGHLHLLGIKSTVLSEDKIVADGRKNADVYAKLIQLLDDKSLSLIMRDAPDNARKTLNIEGILSREGKAPHYQSVHGTDVASEDKHRDSTRLYYQGRNSSHVATERRGNFMGWPADCYGLERTA